MTKSRNNIYGWTDEHEQMLMAVYKQLRSAGIPVDHNGKPNRSAILLYLLEKEAHTAKKAK